MGATGQSSRQRISSGWLHSIENNFIYNNDNINNFEINVWKKSRKHYLKMVGHFLPVRWDNGDRKVQGSDGGCIFSALDKTVQLDKCRAGHASALPWQGDKYRAGHASALPRQGDHVDIGLCFYSVWLRHSDTKDLNLYVFFLVPDTMSCCRWREA